MLRPFFHYVSENITNAGFHENQLFLNQEVGDANAGTVIEMSMDILITDLDPGGALIFEIERGHIGRTEVEIMNFVTDEPILIDTFLWAGINEGPRNAIQFEIPASLIIEPPS